MGWEIFPKGLRILIERLHKEYSKKINYITENGMANNDVIIDGKINDSKRIKFIVIT